jgi:two-component system, cell cycle response regulator DivK
MVARTVYGPRLKGLRVLIVDDDTDAREMYARYFRFQGAEVIGASNGLEGTQETVFEQPDVIILDIAMPCMTGIDAMRLIRAEPRTRRTPILALSGHSEPVRTEALAAGADVFVMKPCMPADLYAEVVRLFRRHLIVKVK